MIMKKIIVYIWDFFVDFFATLCTRENRVECYVFLSLFWFVAIWYLIERWDLGPLMKFGPSLLPLVLTVGYVVCRSLNYNLVELPEQFERMFARSERKEKAKRIGDKYQIALWADDHCLTHVCIELWPLVRVLPNGVFVGLHWLNTDRTYGGHIGDVKMTYDGGGCFAGDFNLIGSVRWNEVPVDIQNELLIVPIVRFSSDGGLDHSGLGACLHDAVNNDLVLSVLHGTCCPDMLREKGKQERN